MMVTPSVCNVDKLTFCPGLINYYCTVRLRSGADGSQVRRQRKKRGERGSAPVVALDRATKTPSELGVFRFYLRESAKAALLR